MSAELVVIVRRCTAWTVTAKQQENSSPAIRGDTPIPQNRGCVHSPMVMGHPDCTFFKTSIHFLVCPFVIVVRSGISNSDCAIFRPRCRHNCYVCVSQAWTRKVSAGGFLSEKSKTIESIIFRGQHTELQSMGGGCHDCHGVQWRSKVCNWVGGMYVCGLWGMRGRGRAEGVTQQLYHKGEMGLRRPCNHRWCFATTANAVPVANSEGI